MTKARFISPTLALVTLLWAPFLAQADVISAPDAHARQVADELVLVDVRTAKEWRETGMPAGAMGITLQDEAFVEKVLARVEGDRSRPVGLICRTGRRSDKALKKLEAAGFTAIYNVREGVEGRRGSGPGWKDRGLPMQMHADAAGRMATTGDPG